MATTKLVIREGKKNVQGECIIYVLYTHQQLTTPFSTHRKIAPEYWDDVRQKVRKSFRGFTELNQALQAKEGEIQKIVNLAASLDIDPTVEYVRGKVEATKVDQPTEKPLEFLPFIEKFIEEAAVGKKRATIFVYRKTLGHLKDFERVRKRGKKLAFDAIDLDFYQDFVEYLTKDLGFLNNTVGKYVKTIKTFLSEATERGLNQNVAFKSKRFKVLQEDSDAVYLNEKEVEALGELDLSKHPKLAKVRDLFVVGCWVGLRFSDLREVKSDNFVEDEDTRLLRVRAIKTGEEVFIPLHPTVEGILNRYDGHLPRSISNQKMNDYLKELCKLAGMDAPETVTTYRGAIRIDKMVKKYEIVSTHTARRSFATNLFLQGLPPYTIMKITGHRTEKAFLRYIKVSAKEHARILKQHWQRLQLVK